MGLHVRGCGIPIRGEADIFNPPGIMQIAVYSNWLTCVGVLVSWSYDLIFLSIDDPICSSDVEFQRDET